MPAGEAPIKQAVNWIEDQLVDREPEHRVADRAIGASRQRPAEEVAEAEVGPQPNTAADGLDRRVEQGGEIRGGLGVDGG